MLIEENQVECFTTLHNLGMSEFGAHFNNLKGITIGDKRRELFLLLNTINLNTTDQDALIDSIKPNDYLEAVFRVDVLLHLKRFEELFDLFKNDMRLVYKILKNRWFCEELTRNIHPKRLVNEIFPSLCLIVRLKLLNKIVLCCNDTEYTDLLFDFIEITYGLKTAVKLLSGCSTNKIQIIISKYDVKLSEGVQLKLAKHKPESLQFYYERKIKMGCAKYVNITSKELCKFLIENRPELFWFVYDNFKVDVRLGHRTAGKAIKNNKRAAMKEPYKLISIIRKNKTAEYFGGDFENFYYEWFPKKISDLFEYSKWETSKEWLLLKSLPKMKRYEIYKKTFESMYEIKLIERIDCVTPELLENIKNGETREMYAKAKIVSNPNEWQWLKYLGKENAVAALKERIKLTSDIKTRTDLLCDLINVCKLNGDVELFLEIIKYYVQNHRNETPVLHETFLDHLAVAYKIENFDDSYWLPLNTIIAQNLKAWTHKWYSVQTVCEKQLQYFLINNASSDKIKALIKQPLLYDSYSSFYYYRNAFKHFTDEHVILAMETIDEVFEDDEKSRNESCFSLLRHICEWNKVKNHSKITIPKKLFESLKYEIEVNNINDLSLLPYLLRSGFYDEIYTLYWKCFGRIIGLHTTLWLLKNKPEVVLNNFDTLVKDEHLEKLIGYEFFDLLFKYEHLDFPQKMIEASTIILNEEENDHKNHAIRILSHLLSVEKFNDVTKKYYPTQTKIDITTEEERLFYTEQCAVAANIYNLHPPIEAFSILRPFLKGDYVKMASCSLTHLLQTIPQNKLNGVLEKLKTGPLTLQKTISAFHCNVFHWRNTVEYLKTICDPTKHVSLRKHLFITAFRFFIQNPYEECWLLLQETIKILDKNDVEAFDRAVKAEQIPFCYRAPYMKFLWKILVETEINYPELKNHKYKLLAKLTQPLIKRFSHDFNLEIVKSGPFQKICDDNKNVLGKFIAKCVINADEENLNELLKAVMVYAKKSKAKDRYLFVRRFCLQSVKTYTDNFDRFTNCWHDTFSEIEAFREYVFLQFTSFYHKNEYSKLPSLLVSFFEDCCRKYSTAINELFVMAANEAFRPCLRLTEINRNRPEIIYIYDFIKGVFDAVNSNESKLLVLELIGKDYDVPNKKFDYIFKELHKNCNDTIRLHLNNFKYVDDYTINNYRIFL